MSDGHDHEEGHEDAADAHDAHDAHDDHGFDGEPARELGAEEPHTPLWLPAVGAGIFVLAAIFLLWDGDATAGTSKPAEPAQTVAAPMVAKPAAPARAVPVTRPAPTGAAGSGTVMTPPRKLDTAQMKELQKKIQEAREKKQAAEGAK